jgi:microcystin-dependent protein
MSQPFLGSLMCVAFNFAPKGWVLCAGQLLPINQNQALFSLLGTTFGGNGQTTFALPDLRGRAAQGTGQNLLGSPLGTETVTLSQQQMPLHVHTVSASSTTGTLTGPGNDVLAGAGMYVQSPPDPAAGTLAPASMATVGGSQPHENRSPSMAMNWIIALQGIFPSRN